MYASDPQAGPSTDETVPTVDAPESRSDTGRAAPEWLRWMHGRLPAYGPPVYRRHSYLQVAVFAAIMVLAGEIWNGDGYLLSVMTTAFTYAIAAVGLYFAYSLGGLFAFSQAAFMGLGAYVSAKIGDAHGFLLGFVGAIVVCFVVALAVGLILRRARHLYFAVGALAVAELMGIAFANWKFLGGNGSGEISGIVPPQIGASQFITPQDLYWFSLVVICLVMLGGMLVERAPMRRNALAIKESPLVAQASGVPVYKITIMLFAFGCALAGIAGSVEAHSVGAISPDAFNVGLAINLYLMLLIGGLRSIWGGVVGALFFVWVPEWLRPVQQYETVIYSFLLLATIIVVPEGIIGTLGKLTRKAVAVAKRH